MKNYFTLKMIIARQIVVLYLIVMLFPFGLDMLNLLFTKVLFKYIGNATYVSEIKGTPEEVKIVKNSLDFFNNLCNNNRVIKFEKPKGLYSRPVIITVREFNEGFELNLEGYTRPYLFHPTIDLRSRMDDPKEFKETIIHEMMHVYFIGHSDNYCDLMYYADTTCISTANIKEYCLYLEKELQ